MAGRSRGRQYGISVTNVTTFGTTAIGGGITNSGTISAQTSGIDVSDVRTFNGGITNSGTISAQYSGIYVGGVSNFSGGISNSGQITAPNGPGIYLGDIANFSGGINNSGTITAKTGIQIDSNVSFSGAAAIVNTGTITGSVAAIDASRATSQVDIVQAAGLISGAIKLSNNRDALTILGGAINGNIIGGASIDDTVTFALSPGQTFTYASPYGFHQIGQVNINSGTVVLNGQNDAQEVAVNSGGTLAGDGVLNVLSYATLTVNNGATLSPGVPGSIGTLSVNGEVVFQPGATYAVTITPTASSQTVITGAATLGGATVAVTPLLGTYLAHTYTILTASQAQNFGSTNTFNPTVDVTRSGLISDPTLSYDAHDVYLSIPTYINTINLTPLAPLNAQNAANSLNNYILAGNALPAGMQGLSTLSGAALTTAVNQLAGQQQGAFALGAIKADDLFLNLMLNAHVAGREDATPGAQSFHADASPNASAIGPGPGATYWGGAYGGGEKVSGNAFTGAARETGSIYGYGAGVDFHVQPDTTLGFALGGGGTGFSLGQRLGSGYSQTFQAGVSARCIRARPISPAPRIIPTIKRRPRAPAPWPGLEPRTASSPPTASRTASRAAMRP